MLSNHSYTAFVGAPMPRACVYAQARDTAFVGAPMPRACVYAQARDTAFVGAPMPRACVYAQARDTAFVGAPMPRACVYAQARGTAHARPDATGRLRSKGACWSDEARVHLRRRPLRLARRRRRCRARAWP